MKSGISPNPLHSFSFQFKLFPKPPIIRWEGCAILLEQYIGTSIAIKILQHKNLNSLSLIGGIVMIATEVSTRTVKTINASMEQGRFYSVEFAVDEPHPLYQFKIWRSEASPMFVVVKKNSAVLPKLKSGSILNMTYYSSDAKCPKRQMETRIGHITSEREGRFEGYCTVPLVPVHTAGYQN